MRAPEKRCPPSGPPRAPSIEVVSPAKPPDAGASRPPPDRIAPLRAEPVGAPLALGGDLPGVRYGEKKGKVRRGEGGGERGGRKGKEILIMWAWGPPCWGSTVSLAWCG